MRVLITGGRGLLAGELKGFLAGHEVLVPGREELDITDQTAVGTALDAHRPDVVINTAAFHNVDLCETEPECAFAVNAAAPQRLAAACERIGALFVHVSTDYVFDGRTSRPYAEDDAISPINVYGCSKGAGEMAIRCTLDRHLIVRTTGLYGSSMAGTSRINFVEKMLELAAAGKPISVVSDQVLGPSYARDVAAAMLGLIDAGSTGTFHVTNAGECSWFEFASEIFRLAGMQAEIAPVNQADRPMPARRPAYSVLANRRLVKELLPPLRHWQQALAAYLAFR